MHVHFNCVYDCSSKEAYSPKLFLKVQRCVHGFLWWQLIVTTLHTLSPTITIKSPKRSLFNQLYITYRNPIRELPYICFKQAWIREKRTISTVSITTSYPRFQIIIGTGTATFIYGRQCRIPSSVLHKACTTSHCCYKWCYIRLLLTFWSLEKLINLQWHFHRTLSI